MRSQSPVAASRIIRVVFATATITLFFLAILTGGDPNLFAAAAGCGAVWWAWDLILEHLLHPLGGWLTTALLAGGAGVDDSETRPKLDDLVRLLEGHIVQGTSRQVDINAAIRLEEIYRTVKRDPERARAVIETVRARYPDAPELARYVGERGDGADAAES